MPNPRITEDEKKDLLSRLTVLEASDLAKALEETWGVSAAAAVAVAAPAPVNSPSEEDSVFDVILTGDGGKKIQVIKEVRAITGLGLTEAKALVEGAPAPLLRNIPEAKAREVRDALHGVGGIVRITPTIDEAEQIDENEIRSVLARAIEQTLLDEPSNHLAYIRRVLAPVMRA